jgi:DNA-binding CsgD family transcriptional regulator
MTGEGEPLIAAIEAIYDAAAAPQLWPHALHRIAQCFDAEGATLQDQRDDGTFLLIGSPGMEEAVRDYQQNWWDKDIRVARALEHGFLLTKGVVTDQDLATPQEIELHPIYTQYLPRHGLGWAMGVVVAPHPRVIAAIGVQRAKSKGPFTEPETQTLARLGRHVEKSMRLSIRLQDAEVLLDTGGQVIFANAVAQALNGDGLVFNGRYLAAQEPVARAALDSAIAGLTHGRVAGGQDDIRPVLLRGGAGKRPKAAYVIPAGAHLKANLASPLSNVAGIVLVIGLDARSTADPALLRDLLGVTLGEARLAAIVGSGIGPRDAAETLGITEETARVVLKRVFAKTGVSRQSELTALISRLTLAP